MKYYELNGEWRADIGDGKTYFVRLPGTLDENGIGYEDTGKNQWNHKAEMENKPIATRFTRCRTYEGPARFRRMLPLPKGNEGMAPYSGKRIFLEAERARCLTLLVNGRQVKAYEEESISTPHIYEVTGLLEGEDEIELISDNSYPDLPRGDIVFSSAATDETQTNWNGVLGYLRLRMEEPVFVSAVSVTTGRAACKETLGAALTVRLELDAACPYAGRIELHSKALSQSVSRQIEVLPGRHVILFENLAIADTAKWWDEYEGNLYELRVAVQGCEEKTVSFGIRIFGDNAGGRLAINGRPFFLRGEANCAVFPETGYPPMTEEEWSRILLMYKSYGVNCMRFHSHCPPDAAFTAADKIGMMMQPELSCWNPRNAFESEESFACYRAELTGILRMLANHPSFVMLTFGNELCALEKGRGRMRELLEYARSLDATRLYANASNPYYGAGGCDADSDFYTAQRYRDMDIRGTFAALDEGGEGIQGYINNRYPGADKNYDEAMEELRREYKKPVFSFEVGQFEVLPDFDELGDFHGISRPVNLELIQEKVKRQGMEEKWKRYVEATGELARIGYREEVEAAMRTRELSGISLLGLQDFPGQGTALVGMLNSHLQPKPFSFAGPEAFHGFFTDQLPLVLLPRYTWEGGGLLRAPVRVANFGKKEIAGDLRCELLRADACRKNRIRKEERNSETEAASAAEGESSWIVRAQCPAGQLTDVGVMEIPLPVLKKPVRMDLRVRIGEIANVYPVWIYPPVLPECPKEVYETEHFDDRAMERLREGGVVYLSPASTREALPCSIQAQFTTDFWSVGTFAGQEGAMGQLIDETHPLFEDFPTEFHTNWQWWPMAVQRAVILPGQYEAIIAEMDSYAFMRPMAQLFECRCMGGRLLFSSFGLQNLQQYPECRALLASIYRYLSSERFDPAQEILPKEIASLVR